MDWATAGGPHKPSPSREQIVAALRALDGGPVAVGPLAFRVCEEMAIDPGDCGAYDLRGVISWGGYLSRLRGLVNDGTLLALPKARWREVSGGVLFCGDGHDTVLAYATAGTAAAIRRASAAPPPARQGVLEEAALHHARARVLAEHEEAVHRYARQWLAAHPAGRQEAASA